MPVAVLAAMLFPSLLVEEGQVALAPSKIFLWAAVPTFMVAWKTRSLFGSVVVGMVLVATARYIFA